jgi:hypothetical protein
MSILTYVIPSAWRAAEQAGTIELIGAVLKDKVTGQIVAHVQPTQVFEKFLGAATSGVVNTVSQGFSPLGAISVVQNQIISQKLTAMSASLSFIQSAQMATLAVSGLGLGVSVVGFAVVHHRLKGIEQHLQGMSEAVARATSDRRHDDLKKTFIDIRTQVDVIQTLEERRDQAVPGHAAQQRLADLAGHVESHMTTHMDNLLTRRLTKEDLEILWSLAAAIRLCHDMGARALYMLDDLGGAAGLTGRQANHFINLIEHLSPPDALARLAMTGVSDRDEAKEVRAQILPIAQELRNGMHATAAGIASQSSLSRQLLDQGIPGPDYLAEVEAEKEQPLLYLPVQSPKIP